MLLFSNNSNNNNNILILIISFCCKLLKIDTFQQPNNLGVDSHTNPDKFLR